MPNTPSKRTDLILWRHAESDESDAGLLRSLSPRGQKQAAWTAAWLQQRLPARYSVYSSPALSARQTALAVADKPRVCDGLGPGVSARDVLEAVDWPNRKGCVLIVVGHQPALGHVASRLLTGLEVDVSIRKGGLWWIAWREKDGKSNVVVRAVVSPDLR